MGLNDVDCSISILGVVAVGSLGLLIPGVPLEPRVVCFGVVTGGIPVTPEGGEKVGTLELPVGLTDGLMVVPGDRDTVVYYYIFNLETPN